MKKIALVAAATLGLTLAACDSPAEEAAEENAEAMEAEADDMEDAAEGDTDAMTEDMEEAVN